MIRWAAQANLPLHILLTKADKLNHGPASNALLKVRSELAKSGVETLSVQTFSALKKAGLDDLQGFLNQWLN